MRVIRFIFSLRFALILSTLTIILLVSTRLLSFSLSEDSISKSFKPIAHEPVHHYYNYEDDQVHYVTCGDSSLTPLLMIHGSPGTWDNYVKLISETDLLEQFYVIAADRPGYGETGMTSRRSLQEQSEILGSILTRYLSADKGVLLGHSYGGAVCLQLAVDYPSGIQAVVLAAGTVADIYQEPKWYNYLVKYTPVGWLLDGSFKTSNQEMWLLAEDLRSLYPDLGQSSIPTAIIQGGRDFLVDSDSPNYLKSKLFQAKVKVFYKEDMDHFLIWNDQAMVLDALIWARDLGKQ